MTSLEEYTSILSSIAATNSKRFMGDDRINALVKLLHTEGLVSATILESDRGITRIDNCTITPRGVVSLHDWNSKLHAASWKSKVTPAFLFLLGTIVSPVINDIYVWRVKPLVTGIVPDRQSADEHDAPKQNRSNQ